VPTKGPAIGCYNKQGHCAGVVLGEYKFGLEVGISARLKEHTETVSRMERGECFVERSTRERRGFYYGEEARTGELLFRDYASEFIIRFTSMEAFHLDLRNLAIAMSK
jgi:hypothetical protein